MAWPMNPKSFDLAGDAFRVAEGVGYTLGSAHFAVSANGALAYHGGRRGEETQLTWFDRAGKPLGALGGRAAHNNLALSRDAARAAVVETERQTRNSNIWVFDQARGIPPRFTFHEASDWDPVWPPDGSRIAFSSNRDGIFAAGREAPESPGRFTLLLVQAFEIGDSQPFRLQDVLQLFGPIQYHVDLCGRGFIVLDH